MSEEIDLYTEVSIVDLLDHALIETNNEQYGGVRKKSPLRPSSSGKCERALAYEYEEFHKQIPATVEEKEGNVVRLLNLGHHIERALISDLYKLNSHFGMRVCYRDQIVTCGKLEDGTIIQGEIDMAIESEDGFKLLCDSKSAKVKHHSFMKDSWHDTTNKWSKNDYVKVISETCYLITDTYKFTQSLGADFKILNILQLNLYAHSPFFTERGYEYCSLLYYIKNDSRVYELRFKKCPKLYKEVMDKFNSAYETGKTDPSKSNKTFHFGSIFCAFCPYQDRCWSEKTDAKYAYFQTLPKKRWPKDLNKLENSEKLEKLFTEYEKCLTKSEEASNIELEIAKELYDQKVDKVKFRDDSIWEVKTLKTKGLVLRRSKL